jgi:hypothetical protein
LQRFLRPGKSLREFNNLGTKVTFFDVLEKIFDRIRGLQNMSNLVERPCITMQEVVKNRKNVFLPKQLSRRNHYSD